MHSLSFLRDLALVVGVGALVSAIFLRLRQPLIVGYLLTGLLLSSHFPFFPDLHHEEDIQLLGQLGVIFLMFFVGMEFNFDRMKRIGPSAVVAGVLEIAFTAWLGFVVGRLFGWETLPSLFLGAVLCISSTTIIVKTLTDAGKIKEEFASLVVGMLVVEDVVAVLLLVLLSGWATTGSPGMEQVLSALGRVTGFSVISVAVGLAVFPRLLRWLDRNAAEETLGITAVGACIFLATAAAWQGFSPALGAFLAGAVVAESGLSQKFLQKWSSLKDLFAAIFFVTVGLQIDMGAVLDHPLFTLAALLVVLSGKISACSWSAALVGRDLEDSARVGLTMAQIGEFSFIIASLGLASHAAPAYLLSTVVAVSTVTAFTTPYLLKNNDRISGRMRTLLPEGLTTLITRYQSWTKALRLPLSRLTLPRVLYPLAARAVLLILLLIASVAANRWALDYLEAHHDTQLLFPGDTLILKEVFFGLVYLTLYLLSLTTLRKLYRHLLKGGGEAMDTKGQTLLVLFLYASAVVIGVVFLAVASPFVSAITLLLVVAGVLLFLAGGLRKTLMRVEGGFDGLVKNIVDSYGSGPDSLETVKDLMRERYPLEARTTDFMLPPTFCGVNRTLDDLHIRSKTGATVLSVYRGEESFSELKPHFQFLPGDVLVLLGEKEHLEAASQYLAGLCKQPHPDLQGGEEALSLETVVVPENSPLNGRSLKELDFRARTGATVVGLERGGTRYSTLSPAMVLLRGDTLWLVGQAEEVEKAKEAVEDLSDFGTLKVEDLVDEAIERR